MKLIIILSLLLSACGVAIYPEPLYVVEAHPYPVPQGRRGEFCRTTPGVPLCDPGLVCAHRSSSVYFTWQTWQCINPVAYPVEMFNAIYPPNVIATSDIFE